MPNCISKHCRPCSSRHFFQLKEVDVTVDILRAPTANNSQFFEQKDGNTLKSVEMISCTITFLSGR